MRSKSAPSEGSHGEIAQVTPYTLKRKMHHVAVFHDVVLALHPELASGLAASLATKRHVVVIASTSALMKPRSKSEWMTPAACGALAPRESSRP